MYIHPEIARIHIAQRVDERIAEADAGRRAMHARQGRKSTRTRVARRRWPHRKRVTAISPAGPLT